MKNNGLKKIINKSIALALIWTIMLVLLYFLFNLYFTIADFQWVYDISPDIYYSLKQNYLNNNLLFLIGFVIWTIGIISILIYVIYKFFKFNSALTNSINDLYQNDIDYITLPKELEELEQKLNKLKRESEKNERLARENEQKKNDLIVYLAHDLKTPLTSIIGYLSLLDEINDMPKDKQTKYIKTTLDKAYKLEDLINELFDIARFNSETIIINKEELNLNMMLEQIIDDFYPILKENNKEINLEYQDEINLMGDSDKLGRVFNNLIKNAIYYSTDKDITIKINKDDNNTFITVTNKGIIPEDKLNKIFEKFYRVDYARNTKTGGSGLGLAIAKEIVELHNGRIEAKSTNGYTSILVTLPLN